MQNPQNQKAAVLPQTIEKTFTYRGQPMVITEIKYPVIKLYRSPAIESRINSHYKFVAMNLLRYSSTKLYTDAVNQYRESQKNGYPFNPYGSGLTYTVTMNQDCHFSTYTDRYEYTGGAHGLTTRTSANWNLQTGQNIKLQQLFGGEKNFRQIIIREILKQARINNEKDPGIYFENYEKLIQQTFNPRSFYLTPEGIVFYFQQYDIAPYAVGIVAFTLTYECLDIKAPKCRKI